MSPVAPGRADDAAKHWGGMATLVLSIAAVASFAAICHVLGIVVCPLKRFTGVPCPSCGTTRACLAMLRGDVRSAFAIQPFAVTLLFGVAPALLAATVVVGQGRMCAFLGALFARRPARWLCAALVAVDWIYVIRNGN